MLLFPWISIFSHLWSEKFTDENGSSHELDFHGLNTIGRKTLSNQSINQSIYFFSFWVLHVVNVLIRSVSLLCLFLDLLLTFFSVYVPMVRVIGQEVTLTVLTDPEFRSCRSPERPYWSWCKVKLGRTHLIHAGTWGKKSISVEISISLWFRYWDLTTTNRCSSPG